MANAFDKLLFRIKLTADKREYDYDHHVWTYLIWKYFKR